MKRKTIVSLAVAALILAGVSAWFLRHRERPPFVVHQRPYKWDSYVRPDLHFTMEPMTDVIAKVNAGIREASNNAVPEAIKLDTTPTRIVKIGANSDLDPHMEQLIADYRKHEKEMNRLGARGFESAPFIGTIPGNHSLWCYLVMPGVGGLNWEEKEDALHASRLPSVMECRPYYIADDLFRHRGWHVGMEPTVSALLKITGIDSGSNFLPNGPGQWISAHDVDSVFRYVPDLNVILALAIPEEHAEAERRLKESGLWVEQETKQEGHNKPDAGDGS